VLDRDEVDALFPAELPEPEHWERAYPPRELPDGAQVTRFSPSPTGSVHLGSFYVALLDHALAAQSGGVYLVRIEDTDQARTVAGATEQLTRALHYAGLLPQEAGEGEGYGPFTQSHRSRIYLSYVRQFLRDGKAYLCFADRDELASAAAEQRDARVPTGYSGRWAIWRDAPAERVRARLAAGDPYVVRFRSPGEVAGRVTWTDLIRGPVSTDENRNDIVILKSSDQPNPLPTYHFAHLVDDHLMRVTLVIRGEEWLPSVPVHLQLFDAAGFDRVPYAHIAPLMKQDGTSRRKLSKRLDPEASLDFYIDTGYPLAAVRHYLRGLANGRLAELPVEQAAREPIRLAECGTAGPLVDLVKLDDIAADLIASMSGPVIVDHLREWAATHDQELAHLLTTHEEVALRALAIEREGVANPRKDLRTWSDFRPVYGYFFPALFEPVTDPADPRLGGLDPVLVRRLCADLVGRYRGSDDAEEWFDQIRNVAAAHGFAGSVKEHRADPAGYVGSIREAAQVIRVLLTGSTRSPGLHAVAAALGAVEVRRRLAAVLPGGLHTQ
jgi:glutamyl-tRNA synthetase